MRDDFRFGISSASEVFEEYGFKEWALLEHVINGAATNAHILPMCSQVVIFRPPAMNTKMEDSTVVFEGDDLVEFIKDDL